MTKTALAISSLALVTMASVPALAQQKVGVVQMQAAIVGTKDGQKAAADLEGRMGPKRKELEAEQAEIRRLQESLSKGGPAMNEQTKIQLTREIDTKGKSYKRSLEDAQAEVQGEQDRILNELGAKLMAVINKYAKDKGFSLVIDVSNPQTPVMYASEAIDITKDVIDMYDRTAAAPAAGAAKPVTITPPAAAAVKK